MPLNFLKIEVFGPKFWILGRQFSDEKRICRQFFDSQKLRREIDPFPLNPLPYVRTSVAERCLAVAGYTNSGDEELSHWNEMRESNGDEMCRWHILLEP